MRPTRCLTAILTAMADRPVTTEDRDGAPLGGPRPARAAQRDRPRAPDGPGRRPRRRCHGRRGRPDRARVGVLRRRGPQPLRRRRSPELPLGQPRPDRHHRPGPAHREAGRRRHQRGRDRRRAAARPGLRPAHRVDGGPLPVAGGPPGPAAGPRRHRPAGGDGRARAGATWSRPSPRASTGSCASSRSPQRTTTAASQSRPSVSAW